MADLLTTLVRRDHPVDTATWHSFLDRLSGRRLMIGEAAAVLASLSTTTPHDETVGTLVDCLDTRRDAPTARFAGTVNIVGTGGGPPTFNISTAAAVVAAAIGVRVVKTCSHAHSSQNGSFDLLDRLGIARTGSHAETADQLDRLGIAFAGHYVYPPEIDMLAREISPLGMHTVGRFVNTIGPFLADVPVTAQLTGVAAPAMLTTLRYLADRERNRRIWLCHNTSGADELVTMADNEVWQNDGEAAFTVPRGRFGEPGVLADLRPAPEDPASLFLAVLAGHAPEAAVHTVCLNAAALAVLSGRYEDWDTAHHDADQAIRDGAASRVIRRLRIARVPLDINC